MRLPITHRRKKQADWRVSLLKLLAVVIMVYLLWQVQQAVLPVCICFIIALLLDGLISKWQHHGIKRTAGICIIASMLIGVVVLLALVMIPKLITQLSEFISSIPKFNNELQVVILPFIERTMERHHDLLTRLNLPTNLQVIADQVSTFASDNLNKIAKNLFIYLSQVASLSIWFVIGPIITIFALGDMPYMRRRFHEMLPQKHSPSILLITKAIGNVWAGYIKGMFTVSITYGIVITCIAALLGVSYPLVIGCMTALLYLVPYIGFLAAATIAGTLAYLTPAHDVLWVFHVPNMSIYFTVLMVATLFIMNFTFDQAITPRIAGQSAGLRPFASVAAMLFGANLLGVWGMIIAIPVTASLWILLQAIFPNLAPPDTDRKDHHSKPTAAVRSQQHQN